MANQLLKFDRKKFYDRYRREFGQLTQQQVDGLNQLLDFEERDQSFTLRQFAYVLATIGRETGRTYHPIIEWGDAEYFSKYEPGTKIGKMLGNTKPGDGMRLCGHGYCMITGERNFRLLGGKIGVDLYTHPELALVPEYAWQITVLGMIEGLFTGKAIGRYINDRKTDYYNARRVINGTDNADRIAQNALRWQGILEGSLCLES